MSFDVFNFPEVVPHLGPPVAGLTNGSYTHFGEKAFMP
jgi:hypothetical protein